MRETDYNIFFDRIPGYAKGTGIQRAATKNLILGRLSYISIFNNNGIYVLPKAKTRVQVKEEDGKLTFNIRTNRIGRVEKSLRKILDDYCADWSGKGDSGMRGQDKYPSLKSNIY